MMFSILSSSQWSPDWSSAGHGLMYKSLNQFTPSHAMKLACAIDGASPLRRLLLRPKGRCHIMVPAGGANAEGWLAFRDVLARIEAYTSRAAPVQVSSIAHALALLRHALSIMKYVREQDRASWAFCASTTIKQKNATSWPLRRSISGAARQPCQVSMMLNDYP